VTIKQTNHSKLVQIKETRNANTNKHGIQWICVCAVVAIFSVILAGGLFLCTHVQAETDKDGNQPTEMDVFFG
jgi:hypothetical protein